MPSVSRLRHEPHSGKPRAADSRFGLIVRMIINIANDIKYLIFLQAFLCLGSTFSFLGAAPCPPSPPKSPAVPAAQRAGRRRLVV